MSRAKQDFRSLSQKTPLAVQDTLLKNGDQGAPA